MKKQLYCGSSCVKYILEKNLIDTDNIKSDMIWISELALSLKQNGLSNLHIYCYNSKVYTEFINAKINLSFDGFKYLKELENQNIQIVEKNISINSFASEIDSCKYMILCVESSVFNNDTSMVGGHYVILNGRKGNKVKVINPIKEKYEIKTLNINFLIKACKDYGAWRIIIMEEKR